VIYKFIKQIKHFNTNKNKENSSFNLKHAQNKIKKLSYEHIEHAHTCTQCFMYVEFDTDFECVRGTAMLVWTSSNPWTILVTLNRGCFVFVSLVFVKVIGISMLIYKLGHGYEFVLFYPSLVNHDFSNKDTYVLECMP